MVGLFRRWRVPEGVERRAAIAAQEARLVELRAECELLERECELLERHLEQLGAEAGRRPAGSTAPRSPGLFLAQLAAERGRRR